MKYDNNISAINNLPTLLLTFRINKIIHCLKKPRVEMCACENSVLC